MNITFSKTIHKIKSGTFFVFALFLLGLSGCEKPSLMEPTATPSVNAFLNDDPSCIEGERREFGMEASTEPQSAFRGMDLFISYFSFPGYLPSSECLCKVDYVELEFDYLPAASDISVFDDQGLALPFSPPIAISTPAGTRYRIEVYANDHEPDIMIDFAPTVTPIPTLMKAGGYCVVDNVSAPDPTTLLTIPYLEYDPENEIKRTYIPAASATATP